MNFKINLHAHTDYSDGVNTIEEMARISRKIGFTALVITDHFYPGAPGLSLSLDSFNKQIEEARIVSNKLKYPIILGAECILENKDEVNVFGTDAIKHILRSNSDSIELFKQVKKDYNCSMILNHPSNNHMMSYYIDLLTLVDGYELYNRGIKCIRDEDIEQIFTLVPFYSNSDAHIDYNLNGNYNIVTEKITTEDQLINFLKSKKGPCGVAVEGTEL